MSARYVVDGNGKKVAVLLEIEEYECGIEGPEEFKASSPPSLR